MTLRCHFFFISSWLKLKTMSLQIPFFQGEQGQAEPDLLSRGAGQVAEPSPQRATAAKGLPCDPPPDARLSPRMCPASPLGHHSASGSICSLCPPIAGCRRVPGRTGVAPETAGWWPSETEADTAWTSQERPSTEPTGRCDHTEQDWGSWLFCAGSRCWERPERVKGSRPSGWSAPPEQVRTRRQHT